MLRISVLLSQVAPAVRVAIGEEFGLKPGKNSIGKIYTALRMCGFDTVFDTSVAADLTIVEEAAELVAQIGKSAKIHIETEINKEARRQVRFQFSLLLFFFLFFLFVRKTGKYLPLHFSNYPFGQILR